MLEPFLYYLSTEIILTYSQISMLNYVLFDKSLVCMTASKFKKINCSLFLIDFIVRHLAKA